MRLTDIRSGQIVKYKRQDGRWEEWRVKGLIVVDTGFIPLRKRARTMVEVHGTHRRFFPRELVLVKDTD